VNIWTFIVRCHLLSEYSFGRQPIKYYFWCNALWVLLIKKTYFTVKPCGTFSFGPVWSFPVKIEMYNRLMMITTVFPHHRWITAMETWKPIAWTRPFAVQVRNWFDFKWGEEIYLFFKVSRPALFPTVLQWVMVALPPGVQVAGHETDLVSNAEINLLEPEFCI